MIAWLLSASLGWASDVKAPPPFTARRAIYCTGARIAVAQAWVEAYCAGRTPWRTYHLRILGAGVSYQLVRTNFRLRIDFPVERYDKDFDPWPGEYWAVITGAALGLGYAEISAFAGNKTIRGRSIDQGLGVDFTFAALLVID